MENINFPSKKKWVKVKLGDLASTITKGSTPTTYGFNYLDKGIPFIKIENIENDKINHRSIRQFISNEAHEYQSRSQLQEGDILFSIAGTIGKTCIVAKNNIPSNTNQALSIIRGTNKHLLPKFLKLQFLSILSTTVKEKARGGAMSNISLNDLKKMDILLPSIQEQNRIVEKIEELFSDLDKATEELKKTQKLLKIYRQSVLKAAFEGKLTEEWRRKNELKLPEEILKIRRNNIKEIYKIPLSWKWLFLNDIGFVVSGGTPSTKEPKYFNGEIPWITPKDLSGYNKKYISKGSRNISKKGLKKSSAKLLPKGSIVFSSRAPIGYTAITENELCTNQGFKNLVLNDGINSEYVYYYLRNNKSLAERYASGTTFKEISGSKFAILPIPLCNLKEQEQVVNEIESRLSVCDKIEETVKQGLNKIYYLRQSILKKTFEGKLVPQNPNDEPAEKLLERIKQEKEKFEPNNKKRKKR